MPKFPRILTVAGSDSSGGAGIEGDIKTITTLGGYAESCITALTAQNTQSVSLILISPTWFIKTAFEAVVFDIGVDAIKTGMLPTADCVKTLSTLIKKLKKNVPIVVDPVMCSKVGVVLVDDKAMGAVKKHLLPLATLFTPNIPEAEILTGLKIRDPSSMIDAAYALIDLGAEAVLVKGGHLSGSLIIDVLVTLKNVQIFKSKRVKTRHSHGTGCALSSAAAVYLAKGLGTKRAVAKARQYVLKALGAAPRYGKGSGPMGHNLGRSIAN